MAGEIGQAAAAVRHRLAVPVAQPGRQGGSEPAPEPEQDGGSASQRARASQRGDGLAALA